MKVRASSLFSSDCAINHRYLPPLPPPHHTLRLGPLESSSTGFSPCSLSVTLRQMEPNTMTDRRRFLRLKHAQLVRRVTDVEGIVRTPFRSFSGEKHAGNECTTAVFQQQWTRG